MRTRVGTANRDIRYKVFPGKEHEKDLYGKFSPAPNAYNPSMAPSSRVPRTKSFAFGSGDRFSEIKSNNAKTLKVLTPGPGEYVV